MTGEQQIPVVLVFAGLDPTGGAGIQADIETTASMGCHAAPIVTSLTVQDTVDVKGCYDVSAMQLIEQTRAVLEDIPVAACKIGLVGSIETVEALHTILTDYPDIPVVFDPVLASGSGTSLVEPGVQEAMLNLLLPLCTILTPNTHEARALAPQSDSLEAAAHELMHHGCEYVLMTGTHENTPEVVNVLYGNLRRLEEFRWTRLPHSYHGSGCTLAAAVAGLLAQGQEPFSAIREAQEYTWEALRHSYRVGMGQPLPNRLFWARDSESGGD